MSIVSKATFVAKRGLLVAQKYSPEILTGAGIVSLLASGVLASKATLKLEDTVERAADRIHIVNELKNVSDNAEGSGSMTEMKYRREMTKVVFYNSGQFIKLYGPSLTLAAAGTVSILAGHRILHKRNVALVAAYKGLEESFKRYRARVVEELGLDKDFEFSHGVTEVEVTDEETGVVSTETRFDEFGCSPYAKLFERGNPNWQGAGPNYNLMFLRGVQNMSTDRLRANGHLFLNDVYKSLGLPDTPEGAVTGWVYGTGNGDDFVDFGIDDDNLKRAHKLLEGTPNSFLLDFNVDGVMWDKI
jgi:hypothetical protein